MGKRLYSYLTGLLWANLMAFMAYGQPATGLSIYEDISHQWMIYDYKDQLYVPFLPGIHPPTRYLHIVIQPSAWKPAEKLILPIEKETLIFVNNNLSHHIRKRQTLIWDLDSLATIGKMPLLTYVSVDVIDEVPPLLLGGQRTDVSAKLSSTVKTAPVNTPVTVSRKPQTTTLRKSSEQKNYLILTALACGIVLSVFSLMDAKYVSVSESLQRLSQLFKYREVQEKTELRSLFILWLMFALMAAYLLMLVATYPNGLTQIAAITGKSQFFTANYLKIVGWLIFFLWLKHILIRALEWVFGHRLLAEKHIAISAHIYKIFILLAFILFLAYQMSHYYRLFIAPEALSYILFWGWIVVTATTGLILYLSVTQRFVYLITYLCTTEVLPLLLVLKLFLIPS